MLLTRKGTATLSNVKGKAESKSLTLSNLVSEVQYSRLQNRLPQGVASEVKCIVMIPNKFVLMGAFNLVSLRLSALIKLLRPRSFLECSRVNAFGTC